MPRAASSEWETATPDSQGLQAEIVEEALQAGASLPALRSLVVVRHGKLLAERHYGGAGPSDLLPIQSVTKSVASMLVGQALERGRIAGLGQTVASLIPEDVARVPGSALASVTLEQILSGRSDLVYDWSTQSRQLARSDDPVRWALSLPAGSDKPTPPWTYNDAAVSLLAPILARAQGMDMAALAERDLFAPLGIARYAWQRDRSGQPTAYGGLALRTRDLAKLAWLMTDDGRWQGAQVLSPGWVEESLRRRTAATWQVAPVTEVGYGCLWFTGRLHGQRVAWGWGYGAQFALSAPELRLVVCSAAAAPRIEALDGQNRAVMALVARIVQSVRSG